MKFIEEENALAKLSERVNHSPLEDCGKPITDWNKPASLQKQFEQHYTKETIKQENKNMTNNTLREVTITLIDNNVNLEDDQRVVFQKKGVRTSFTNEETKMNTIASGEVMEALKKHNEEVRMQTLNGDILDRTGRDVSLKVIKLLSDSDLEWRIVETA